VTGHAHATKTAAMPESCLADARQQGRQTRGPRTNRGGGPGRPPACQARGWGLQEGDDRDKNQYVSGFASRSERPSWGSITSPDPGPTLRTLTSPLMRSSLLVGSLGYLFAESCDRFLVVPVHAEYVV
jgi:hypothetical protein